MESASVEGWRGLSDRPLKPLRGQSLLTSDSSDQNIPECAQWPELAARFLEQVM